MDEAEQIEELVEHLERVITTLTDRVDRLEQPTSPPYALLTPMREYAPPGPVGFWNRMAPMNPGARGAS